MKTSIYINRSNYDLFVVQYMVTATIMNVYVLAHKQERRQCSGKIGASMDFGAAPVSAPNEMKTKLQGARRLYLMKSLAPKAKRRRHNKQQQHHLIGFLFFFRFPLDTPMRGVDIL